MTAPVSILPISASVDTATGTSLSVADASTEGENSPFTQLLQGMVAPETGQQQHPLFTQFIELSASGELTQEGSFLPDQGQAIALSQLINPFTSLSNIQSPQSIANSAALDDVLTNKPAAVLPEYLSKLTSKLMPNADLNPAAATNSKPVPDATVNAMPGTTTVVAETAVQQKMEPLTTTGQAQAAAQQAITAQLASMPERSMVKNDVALAATSLTSPSGSESSLAMLSASTTPTEPVLRSGVAPAITVPPQNPAWNQQVGERVQWMVNQNMQKAEIRLDPPELGSLEVRIVVQKDQAQVTFAAPHSQVRDALETALPRLKEMLGEQGLDLANVDIGQHSFAQQRENDESERAQMGDETEVASGSTDSQANGDNKSMSISTGNGLLDAYA